MKLFITGAAGFIGSAVCRAAAYRGHEVLALCRQPTACFPKEVETTFGTLEHPPWKEIQRFMPDTALHLAWITTPGEYLQSPQNDKLLAISKSLFDGLSKIGVGHLAGVGTCIEYKAANHPLVENSSLLGYNSLYAKAKLDLFTWLTEQTFRDTQTSAWFRIFFPYGPGEHPNRFCSFTARQLAANQYVTLNFPNSIRDFIFIDDLAVAICQAIEHRITGPINLGTGVGVTLEHLARRIAARLGADSSLIRHATDAGKDPMPEVVADSSTIRKTGWKPGTSESDGLLQLIESLGIKPQGK